MSSEMKEEMVKWQLRQSMGEELTASSVYHVRATQARQDGYITVAEVYEEIAEDEDSHFNMFQQKIQELGGFHTEQQSINSPINTHAVNKLLGISER